MRADDVVFGDDEETETVQGTVEDIRHLPDGYVEMDIRISDDEVATILLTPAAFAEFTGEEPPPTAMN